MSTRRKIEVVSVGHLLPVVDEWPRATVRTENLRGVTIRLPDGSLAERLIDDRVLETVLV